MRGEGGGVRPEALADQLCTTSYDRLGKAPHAETHAETLGLHVRHVHRSHREPQASSHVIWKHRRRSELQKHTSTLKKLLGSSGLNIDLPRSLGRSGVVGVAEAGQALPVRPN